MEKVQEIRYLADWKDLDYNKAKGNSSMEPGRNESLLEEHIRILLYQPKLLEKQQEAKGRGHAAQTSTKILKLAGGLLWEGA